LGQTASAYRLGFQQWTYHLRQVYLQKAFRPANNCIPFLWLLFSIRRCYRRFVLACLAYFYFSATAYPVQNNSIQLVDCAANVPRPLEGTHLPITLNCAAGLQARFMNSASAGYHSSVRWTASLRAYRHDMQTFCNITMNTSPPIKPRCLVPARDVHRPICILYFRGPSRRPTAREHIISFKYAPRSLYPMFYQP
jgi:hypothetical protein